MTSLTLVRLLAVVAALGAALPVLPSGLADPAAAIGDLMVAALLLLAAAVPRRWAVPALAIANAYALGAFGIALAQHLAGAGWPPPGLVVALAACVVAIGLLVWRRGA